MKKIVSFAMPQKSSAEPGEKLVREFAEGEAKGFELDQCIFSTAYNRNHAYFQVSSLMKWKNKLKRILHNFNHNLSESGGQYLGNQTEATKMWSVEIDGEYEVWWTIRSTDPLMIARRNEITGPSVEILVDSENVIKNELGEYYTEVDFVGCAQLTGVIAGSGDSRNTSGIREFNLDLTPFNQNNIMQEQQIKELLEAQKTELLKEFSLQLDEKLKAFATEQVKEEPIVEPTPEPQDEAKTETTGEENPTPENIPAEPTDPVVDPELTKIENQLNQAENLKDKMKTIASFDLVTDLEGAEKSAEKSTVQSFKQSLANTILSNIS